MSKRFTDTEKWQKKFIRNLPTSYKLLWLYLMDECDHAGIWHVDIDVANIRIGEQLNEQDAIDAFNGKLVVFDEGEKWFIPSFIDFQYGELSDGNRVHHSVISRLNKYGLCKHLASPLQGVKDKDKDKDKDKEKAKKKYTEEALSISSSLISSLSKAYNKRLVSKPSAGAPHIQKLLNAGITAVEIAETLEWLTGQNRINEASFCVESARSLYEKWDRIQASRGGKGVKRREW